MAAGNNLEGRQILLIAVTLRTKAIEFHIRRKGIDRKAVDISRKCANFIDESSLQALCPVGPRELSLGFFFFLHDQNGIPDRRL